MEKQNPRQSDEKPAPPASRPGPAQPGPSQPGPSSPDQQPGHTNRGGGSDSDR